MTTLVLLAIAFVQLVTATNNLPVSHRQALVPAVPLACDPDGVQDSGAVYRICMPLIWNGDLLVYAHGYVSPTRAVGIPEEQMTLPNGTSVADLANMLGYAFATTSYSTIHTTGDPVIPYWHATRYRGKIIVADNIALHEHIKVDRYDHCNFESVQVLNALQRLVAMVNNPPPYQPVNRLFLPLIRS